MKKRGFACLIVGLLVIFTLNFSSALGIMPAIKEFNFEPGKRITITYTIISENPSMPLQAYLEGDFAEYASLSKESFVGGGTFTLTINLPKEWDKPGRNRLVVGVRELQKQEEAPIGVSVDIRGVVYINVPYPGKYIEAILNIPNCNSGDEIPLELKLINRGKETLALNIEANFYSKNRELVYHTNFEPRTMESGEEKTLRKMIDTKDFSPGDYSVEVAIDYSGEKKIVNKTLRVGSLSIGIKNFTQRIESGGLKKYFIDVESLWNDYITKVYADVNVSNSSYSMVFRTPPTDLPAWGERRLEGYIDTTGMEGEYNSEITAYFEDKNITVNGKLLVYKKSEISDKLIFIIGGLIAVLIVGVVVYYATKKFAKQGKRK